MSFYGRGSREMVGASGSIAGIGGTVPAPQPGDEDKFLQGDGTWESLPIFQGVSGSIQSISGMLPAAESGDENRAFFGDGNFKDVPTSDMIANIEPSTTSTHAYTIGQQFILNGVLHIATAAISVGDTLAVGTNCAINQSITEQIKKIIDDYGKGIKTITRSGTTFTATALDGTTSTFDQQDNNTTYSAGTDISINSSNQISVSSDTAATANKIVKRNGSGYIYAVYYNQSSSNEAMNSYSNAVPAFFSTDGWLRKSTAAGFRTGIGLGGAATYGATSSVSSGSTNLITSGGVYSYVKGWISQGSATGTNAVNLPSSFTELSILVQIYGDAYISFLIPRWQLSSSYRDFACGRWRSSAGEFQATIEINTSKVYLSSTTSGGTVVTSGSKIWVYYR